MQSRLRKYLALSTATLLGFLGLQVVGAVATSAHTPSASIGCTAWSISGTNYDATGTNTYSYSIDGAAAVTGTFGPSGAFGPFSGTFAVGSGDHTLVGHVYADGAPPPKQYSVNYNLSTTNCVTYIAVPAAPTPTPPTCSSAGSATVPADSATVHWTLTGDVATATAQGNNRFTGGATTKTFTETVLPKLSANSDACATHSTVVAPVFTNGDCASAPSLTGATGGTGYTVAVTGTPGFGNTVTVTFTALPNYRLDGKTAYTFTYAAQPDCRTVVNPVQPAVTQANCNHTTGVDTGFSITPASTPGITYTVNGLVVTATANQGFKLGTLPSGWTGNDTTATYTVTRTDPLCLIDVSPVSPDLSQAACTGPGTSSTPTVSTINTAGINYTVSTDLSTVTANITWGYAFTQPLPSGWVSAGNGTATYQTGLVGTGDCHVSLNPVAPTAVQSECVASGPTPTSPAVTVPDTANVTYTVSAGPYLAGGTALVTATAGTGYTFDQAGLPSGWTLVGTATSGNQATYSVAFAAAPECAIATAPTFADDVCTTDGATGSTLTLPATTGVDFAIDGTTSVAGTYVETDGSTVLVTAQPQAGYTLVGTTSWTHQYDASPECVAVKGIILHHPKGGKPTVATVPVISTLPFTGASTSALARLAALVMAAGLALCIGVRRRRTSTPPM